MPGPETSEGFHIEYNHENYRNSYGEWASFIYPTSRCESEAKFLVINAWDAAGMTFGFFQLAAHTGIHLANLFRELITALPDEADRYFPELKLGSQIGAPIPNHIYAVNDGDYLDLDVEERPQDGLPSSSWYRGRFMRFFNPHRGRLDFHEAVAAARWSAWLAESTGAQEVCVQNAVNTAKETVAKVHVFLEQRANTRFPNGLHGVSMSLVAAAMDVKHHGRRDRDSNRTVNESIYRALRSNNPLGAFSQIDVGWRQDRSERSVREIRAMSDWFDGKVYNSSSADFEVE